MNELKNIEEKIKGYGYDSLCLRYQIAREAQARLEAREGRRYAEPQMAYDAAKRDELRFYEILDDLLGRHD